MKRIIVGLRRTTTLPDFWRPENEPARARSRRLSEIAEWRYAHDPAFRAARDKVEAADEARWESYLERARREVAAGLHVLDADETAEEATDRVAEGIAEREGFRFTCQEEFAEEWARAA